MGDWTASLGKFGAVLGVVASIPMELVKEIAVVAAVGAGAFGVDFLATYWPGGTIGHYALQGVAQTTNMIIYDKMKTVV